MQLLYMRIVITEVPERMSMYVQVNSNERTMVSGFNSEIEHCLSLLV